MRITHQQAMREANLLGRAAMRLAAPPPDSDFWYKPAGAGASTITGIYVTPQSSVQSVTVAACVNKIATTIAMLPKHVYRRGADNARSIDRDHSLYDLVHASPNAELTSFDFWEAEIAKVLTHGNSFSKIEVGYKDRVTALLSLCPPT